MFMFNFTLSSNPHPGELVKIAKVLAQSNFETESKKFFSLAKRLRNTYKLQNGEPLSIRIYSSSDEDKDEFHKLLWGDYWVQNELTICFGRAGYPVKKTQDVDVMIHLFGFQFRMIPQSYNIIWVYSHPMKIDKRYLFLYDSIFVLSEPYQRLLTERGISSEVMIGATAKKPYPVQEIQNQAVFVGNPRKGGALCRGAVQLLKETGFPFQVWGHSWDNFLPPDNIGGVYCPYYELDRLYASNAFSISDHHADMRELGFVAVKIFDILASGGFAISDKNSGIESIFGDTVPQFETAEDLKRIFQTYPLGSSERIELLKRGQEIALKHTWQARTETFVSHINSLFEIEPLMDEIHTQLALLQK
jgi:hypothetical protein